jgi:hypothetical protein
MKTRKLLILSAMLVAFLPAFDAWATGPAVSFGEEVRDLGRVPGGQKVTVRFAFSNRGDHDLVVQDVRADCGCTEISETIRELPPNGAGEIVAVIDTAGAPGKKQRHIHVLSNDTKRPHVTLTILVEVLGPMNEL